MIGIDHVQAYHNWMDCPDERKEQLRKLMAPVQCVLFDFDGPICDLFSGHPAYHIADALKSYFCAHNLLTKEMALENDPQAIFRNSAPMWISDNKERVELFLLLEQHLTRSECRAAITAVPTLNYIDFVEHLARKKIKMAVTTNNSPQAVERFFEYRGVDHFEGNVFGRTGPNPDDLKPNTLILREAMKELKVHPSRCLMIGDSVTDYLAAKAANVPFLGFTYTFDKCAALMEAGAEIVINSYSDLLDALGTEIYHVAASEDHVVR
jgi:phosphoglycolate phosphatase-like HAD superfamily hydrolase